MLIRYGYEIAFHCAQETPIVCLLDIHPERAADIKSEKFICAPHREQQIYIDAFGNKCRRFSAPVGDCVISCEGLIEDPGQPDITAPDAQEIPVASLPADTLVFLLASRYCDTERLSQIAWNMFGNVPAGLQRVRAIVDFVHNHVTFGYQFARPTRTAFETYEERVGVCRDFAHLTVSLCRCMNIPARYVNGYLGDIGVAPNPAPMDFNAWVEVYLGGRWHTFDARHNAPRIGRIMVARGRDATDIAMMSSFGPHMLKSFRVITEEAKTLSPNFAAGMQNEPTAFLTI